jgi:uncharacterized protein (TIGR02266 family)
MTQDTRKDPRAKIVSLNVRYKSATVDEFIENHSYDVSKGGIFIKTPSPFPPGTLLKFEIRIAGDKAVISGVGRVVWKREAGQSTTERPSGMGVKFIKLDDSSRAVIDKLVDAKGPDAGAAFEEGNTEVAPLKPPPPGVGPSAPFDPAPSAQMPAASEQPEEATVVKPSPASVAPRKPAQTMIGVGQPVKPAAGAAPDGPNAAPAAPHAAPSPAAAARPGAPPRRPPQEPPPRPAAGGTAPKPATAEPAAAKPATVSSMFPKTDSLKEMPPTGEQTVMKQAAELLEEALRGAGGSMEEIGSNPLFDVAMKSSPPANGGTAPVQLEAVAKPAPKAEPEPVAAAPVAHAEEPVAAKPARSSEPAAAPEPARRVPPRESARPKASERPPAPARAVAPSEPPPASNNKALWGLVAVAAVGVIGYFAYTQLIDTGAPTPADSSSVVTSPQPPPPASVAPPAVSATPSATPIASTSAAAAASASPPASASASASASAAPPASASASARAAVAPPAVVRPPPVAPPPVAPPPVTVKPVAPPPVAPKPVTPKPRKPADDDNPY